MNIGEPCSSRLNFEESNATRVQNKQSALSRYFGSVCKTPVKMKRLNIQGLIVAPFTPMHDNGEVNLELVGKYVDTLVDQGVKNAFVNGTTGEGMSLTLDERKQLAEKWIQCGKEKLDNVIIHVGSASLTDSANLAKHAASSGADAIALLPPFYHKPPAIDLLVEHMAGVAREAPNTPLLYYHIPQMTGVDFSMPDLLGEAMRRIPSFAGIKFTDFNLFDFARCVDKYGDQLALCYGKDEQLFPALVLGADAGVGSTYNYAGRIYSRIIQACRSRDFEAAKQLQFQSQRFIAILFNHGFSMGLHKALMERVTGIPVGKPRLPLAPTTDVAKQALFKDLKEIGFFDFIK